MSGSSFKMSDREMVRYEKINRQPKKSEAGEPGKITVKTQDMAKP
jgi:hypothetical protein